MFQWLSKYIKRIGLFGVEVELREPSTEAPTSSSNPTPGLPDWAAKFIRTQHDYVFLLESINTKDQFLAESQRFSRLARESVEYSKRYLSLTVQQQLLFDEYYPNRIENLSDRIEAAMSRLQRLGVLLED